MESNKKPAAVKRGPSSRGVATVRSVAREAGVSPATVSRIINGTVKVSDDLRVSVDTAIAKLGFRPNATARGLALGRSLTIGVITQVIDSPFYGEGLRGIESRLRRHGYAPLFMSGNWREEEEDRSIRELIARGVDGIIMFAGRLSDALIKDYARQVPIVVTGRHLSGVRVASLKIDDRLGAELAMRHLIELGHKRIAFIGGSGGRADAVQRLDGYRRALKRAGIHFDPRLVAEGDWRETGGELGVQRLLRETPPVTAIFCVNDQTAYGAYLGLFRAGRSVPHDVSVVGFDDLPASAYQQPPLTSVRQAIAEIGELSVEALVELIGGRRPKLEMPKLCLVIRESTGLARD